MVPTFNDEEKRFLDEVTRWVDECVLPNTRAWEKATFPDDIWKTTAKMGITSCVLPKEFGGRGYSCQTYAELIRIIAKGDPALAMIVGLGGPSVCATNNRVSLGATDERVKMEPSATAPQTLWSVNRLAAAEHRQITTRTH